MNTIVDFLGKTYYNNSLLQICAFLLILLLGFIFKKLLSKLSSHLLFNLFKRHAAGFSRNDLYKLIKRPIGFLFIIIFLFLAFNQLSWPKILKLAPENVFGLKMIVNKSYAILFIMALVNVFRKLIDFLGIILIKKAEIKSTKAEVQLINFAIEALKIAVLIFGIFFILGSVFKINVGTLVAGLGIGGLAIALAAKESLENLLGSFTIFADKPFVVGDMVKVGNTQGIIEKVGFRSTRIRTLDRSYVTLPNKMIVDSEVDNLTERNTRRVNFNLGILYSTPAENIKLIIKDISAYIKEHPATLEDCYVRFAEFGDSSINIMILYFIDGNDFENFVSVREDINFKIMEIVKQHGSGFAFPSRTVYMEGR